jgi:hypothetical protein
MVRKTRRQTKRRAPKGGKFLDQGSYGCGFAPPLRCKGEKKVALGEFSKLMESEEAAKEFKIHEMLEPIDPHQIYFLYPSKICRPEPDIDPHIDKNTTYKNLKKCDLITIDNPDARLLFSKDGGKDLSKLGNLQAGDYSDFFAEQIQLLNGLRVLHTNHICHLDIKDKNIVVKMEGGTFHFRYIDFGFVIKTSDLFVPRRRYENYYRIWAPEMKYINKLTPSGIPDFDKIIAQVGPDQNKQREYLLQKVDVYSLGVLLYTMLKNHMGLYLIFQDDNSALVYINQETGEQEAFEPSAASRLWFGDVKETIIVPYIRLTHDMRNKSPFKRFTIDQAITAYLRIKPNIRRLFTEENIATHLSVVKPHLKRGFGNMLNKFMGSKATAKVAPI